MATHKECIQPVVGQMNFAEKGLLKCILLYGKKIEKNEVLQRMLDSTDALEKIGKEVTAEWVSSELEKVFTQGVGFFDGFKGISYNYGKQLDVTINKVLIKALKIPKPIFQESYDTVAGAIRRETWITEELLNSLIMNMDADTKKDFVNQITIEMAKEGIDATDVTAASAALLHGGLTATRLIMGFGFHKMVAIIANLIVRTLTGHGLSFVANFTMQRMLALLFGGPIAWIIAAVLALPTITSLINPRRYDKYIPAVFILGITRMSKSLGDGRR